MNEIKCPHCTKAFKIDEAGFAEILKQVRDHQFEEELQARLEVVANENRSAIELAEAKHTNALQDELAKKDREIAELKAVKERELSDELAKKNAEIAKMVSSIESAELRTKIAVDEATKSIEKERDALANKLETQEVEKQLLEKSLHEKHLAELRQKEQVIAAKDEQIALHKDLKMKLSTKMVGETLEQHCENEFNKIRATAFQNAYFEKDNDAKSGSKGDYIYREVDEDGNEIISIMFEMKNESDGTATKKKNKDFLKELDKDRSQKNCEFAVLVSMLEPESDLYNGGIVDVSHEYEKMYVIRPQCFILLISLLRNAAKKSMKYKAELNLMRRQNVDVTNFEEKLNTFREGFAKNVGKAHQKFTTAIDEIDKAMTRLQKTRDALVASDKYLRSANTKAEDLSIRKLTYRNPTMKAKFAEVTENSKKLASGEG